MPLISKHAFYEKLVKPGIKCEVLHFNNLNCIEGNYWFLKNFFWGSLKFFIPIYVIKTALNYKKLRNKKCITNIILEEVRSAVYGVILGNSVIVFNCFYCKIFGDLNYYACALGSGIFSGLSVLVESRENRNLDTLIFFNLVIESVLKNIDYYNIFKLTRLRETLMFMVTSGSLMHLLQNREKQLKFVNFWFYMPQLLSSSSDDEKSQLGCYHKEECTAYSFQGSTKYFALGYAVNIIRRLIPKMMTLHRSPSQLLKIVFSLKNVKFGAFIGAYVGLYRYLTCTLFKTKIINQKYFGLISGLLSGATYAIAPNLQVLVIAITTLLQIFYHYLLRIYKIRNYLIPQQIIFMVSNGILLHNAVISRETCPPYYLNMLEICTNNLWSKIYNKVITTVFAA